MDKSWQTNKGLAETNLHMLNKEILCDVTFLVGESRRKVKAHKYMLVSRSPVFYAMFCGPMMEPHDIIEIPDVEIDGFLQLLRFLYSEDCDLTADIVMSLLYVGKKYEVVTLTEKCKKYLESVMSRDNVCVILQQAHMFDEQDLVKQCLAYVFENANEVLKSTELMSLRKDVLHLIVESDKLLVKEEDVYDACVKWAEEKCRQENQDVNDKNVRDALGLDLIKQIRFPCMALNVFSETVGNRDILSSDEKVNVFLHLTSEKNMCESIFRKQPRIMKKRRVHIIRLACPVKELWISTMSSDAIGFECSKDTILVGVSLFAPYKVRGSVAGLLEVLDQDDQRLLYTSFKIVRRENLYEDIIFANPISIEKNTRYTVKQMVSGTCYGCNGKEIVNNEQIKVQFFNSSLTQNCTDISRGQFRCLIFEM